MTTEDADILLVTTTICSASDAVADALRRAGRRFYRLNTEDLPLSATSSIGFGIGSARVTWQADGRTLSLDRVTRVWFRRHRLPALPPETVPAHAEYTLRESQWYLRSLLWTLAERVPGSHWMSPPADVQRAESKILQLQLAPTAGFTCPRTLVSNDPTEIRTFFDQEDGKVIAKALRLGYFDYGERQTAAYTSVITSADLRDDESLRVAPVIYQQHLDKRCDIRVTVVENSLYAAEILSQNVASATVDWRRSDVELEHSRHDLPDEIRSSCLRLVRALNLRFGAIDLVLTPDGQYCFLEINPNGQWLWLEDKLGFPITNDIATWLQQV